MFIFQPGEFVHTLGDHHIYLNHVEPLKIQIQRPLRPFPTLKIARIVETVEDFVLENDNPHPKIKMKMAV